MLRKALFLLCALTMFPALALGWTITAKIGSPSGSITGGSPLKVVSSGTGYLAIPAGDTAVTVTPATGYTVSMVTLDGSVLAVPPAGGSVAVPQAGKSSRTLIAYFTAATYSMTASQSAGGLVTLQRISPTTGSITTTVLTGLRTGNVVRVKATPDTGSSATSLAIGGSQVWSGSSPSVVSYDYTVGSTSPGVSATFVSIPTVTARLSVDTVIASVEGSIRLDASASTSNDPPLGYSFALASGDPAGVSFTPAASGPDPVVTFRAATPGSYTVRVTVTSARGASATATTPVLTVLSQAAYASQECVSCHGGRDPSLVSAYESSTHYLWAAVSCSGCHDPDAALGHPYLEAPGDSCLPCHADATPEVAESFIVSPHQQTGCSGCHRDHTAVSTINGCSLCHAAPHSWESAGVCGRCHETHNPFVIKAPFPHFANFTTARFVTERIGCESCHSAVDAAGETSFNIYSSHREWGRSGKGDPRSPAYVSFDFKTLGTELPATPATSAGDDCVRCHTTTGYVKYVSSGFQDIAPFGTPGAEPGGERTREMIACPACHTPTPFLSYDQEDWDTWTYIPAFSRRYVPQVTAYYNYSGAAGKLLNPVEMPYDAGESNNCIACHSGRTAGSTLRMLAQRFGSAGPFWGDTPLIDPHGMGAAGILYRQNGYEFMGKSYSSPFSYVHWALGEDDPGACVACHMYGGTSHGFSPVEKGEDGVITGIPAFAELCSHCHDSTVKPIPLNDPGELEEKRTGFASSLKALAEVLAQKGIHFNSALSPYFFTTADTQAQGAGSAYRNWNALYLPGSPPRYNGCDLMGAAFNLRLLSAEPGAYVHNCYYAKRLIYDSIDLADDGRVNATVLVTLQNLAGSASFTEADRVRALAYVGVRP